MATNKKAAAAAQAPEETKAMTAPPATTALAEIEDYGDDAGRGFENQDQSDRKIPMLVVIQANSPEVTKRLAMPGQLWNTVTQTAYDAVDVVPSLTDHCFTEWIPRDDKGQGGGFRGRHAKNAPIVLKAIKDNGGRAFGKIPVPAVDAKGQRLLDKDNKPLPDTELVETFEIAAILFQGYRVSDPNSRTPTYTPVHETDAEPISPLMIPFSSTKIKAYREWNTSIGMFMATATVNGKTVKRTVPMFAHRVRITTKLEQRGTQTWYIPVLSPVLPDEGQLSGMRRSLLSKEDPRYVAAKLLSDQYLAGTVTAAYDTGDESAPVAGGAGGGGPEADVPF